jgi:hypothetical protein
VCVRSRAVAATTALSSVLLKRQLACLRVLESASLNVMAESISVPSLPDDLLTW